MKILRKNWFLISLLVSLGMGFYFAKPFEAISNLDWLKWTVVSLTMFLMAWPLKLGQIKNSLSNPLSPLLACAVNLIAIPLMIWPLARFAGAELGPGMLIAAATPSTLASAAVFTRRAGGDDSISIMVTILTNASCFLVMPFWIMVQTGNQIDSGQLIGTIYKLLFFVVLPIGLAQLVRVHLPSAEWATTNKPRLSLLALIGILIMVFLGAVKMGLRFQDDQSLELGPASLAYTAVVLLAVHLVAFFGGRKLAKLFGLDWESQIAVAFSGSQKTLMIGLSTAINLGMSMIPIILFHTIQLITDSFLSERIRSESEAIEPEQ